MESITLAVATLISLAAVWSLSIRSRRTAARLDEIDTRRLDEVVKQSEHIKRTCFVALENMQRSLDALQSRGQAAERNPAGASDGPFPERKGFYEAAALLLEAGQSVERVAQMIHLPADHVMLVQELRRILAKDSAAQTAAKSGEAARAAQQRKKRPRAEREKARPILLTYVVDFDAALDRRNGHQPGDHGAAA